MRRRYPGRVFAGILILAVLLLVAATVHGLAPVLMLDPAMVPVQMPQWQDRDGQPLNITYRNVWNLHDLRPLHAIPELLRQSVVQAEDQRFFEHRGVDWAARTEALRQNLKARRTVRGASTMTEQVVRLLHPRSRSLWSRWLEGFDAARLERHYGKADILEFYLNQVPYGGQRRGVVQAARYYFGRDLATLSRKELLALAVLPRAPDRLDPRRNPEALERGIAALTGRLRQNGALTAADHARLLRQNLLAARVAGVSVDARHFLRAQQTAQSASSAVQTTTLRAGLQGQVASLLRQRLDALASVGVRDAAALVVDHRSDGILAWVSEHAGENPSGTEIDAVRVPRQPGSTLKPFIYGLALERGWTMATLIEDAPLSQIVGAGVHDFRNFSRQHYGWLTLREALGNSLNIPAVKALRFVGAAEALARLRRLGLRSLDQSAEHYGDGLVLGNGEVSLLELVGAYATLARGGVLRPLRTTSATYGSGQSDMRVYARPVAALIADVLADPAARALEFEPGLFDLPVRTAIKTGTSSDFHDAWALGFNGRHTVGVWMGNLDRAAMQGLSGALGPALALRAIFAELARSDSADALVSSSELYPARICRQTGAPDDGRCASRMEWFLPGTEPADGQARSAQARSIEIQSPSEGLRLALDARLPAALQSFVFTLPQPLCAARVEWWVDGALSGTGQDCHGNYAWRLQRGAHALEARVWQARDAAPVDTPQVRFEVR